MLRPHHRIFFFVSLVAGVVCASLPGAVLQIAFPHLEIQFANTNPGVTHKAIRKTKEKEATKKKSSTKPFSSILAEKKKPNNNKKGLFGFLALHLVAVLLLALHLFASHKGPSQSTQALKFPSHHPLFFFPPTRNKPSTPTLFGTVLCLFAVSMSYRQLRDDRYQGKASMKRQRALTTHTPKLLPKTIQTTNVTQKLHIFLTEIHKP